MSNKHPKDNKGNNIENQLINRLIIIFILLALLFLVISWILLYFLSNEALLYWGNLSSSLGFEILGVLVMYKFVSYMLRADVTDQEKKYPIKNWNRHFSFYYFILDSTRNNEMGGK